MPGSWEIELARLNVKATCHVGKKKIQTNPPFIVQELVASFRCKAQAPSWNFTSECELVCVKAAQVQGGDLCKPTAYGSPCARGHCREKTPLYALRNRCVAQGSVQTGQIQFKPWLIWTSQGKAALYSVFSWKQKRTH